MISGMQLVAVQGRRASGSVSTMARNSSMVALKLMGAGSAGILLTKKVNMFKFEHMEMLVGN